MDDLDNTVTATDNDSSKHIHARHCNQFDGSPVHLYNLYTIAANRKQLHHTICQARTSETDKQGFRRVCVQSVGPSEDQETSRLRYWLYDHQRKPCLLNAFNQSFTSTTHNTDPSKWNNIGLTAPTAAHLSLQKFFTSSVSLHGRCTIDTDRKPGEIVNI